MAWSGYWQQAAAPPPVAVQTVQYAAPDPVLPTRRVDYNPTTFNVRLFRIFGLLLAIMAAVTLALGIADVVITMQSYCVSGSGCATTSNEPWVWVWVASGIWASVPIFLAGVFAMMVGVNPFRWTKCFVFFIFLSAIVFAPAMVVLSSIEAWRGWASTQGTFYNNGGTAAGSITASPNPYQAKFAIPIAIAVIGAIMFIMTALVTFSLCCCMHRLGIYIPREIGLYGGTAQQIIQQPTVAPPLVQANEYYYPPPPPRPQIRAPPPTQYAIEYKAQVTSPPPSFDPYSRYMPPTRYSGVPYGASSVLYGSGQARQAQGLPGGFASDFLKPNSAYFWQ